jgi:hypothetical protein
MTKPILLLIVAVTIVVDQLTKAAALTFLSLGVSFASISSRRAKEPVLDPN